MARIGALPGWLRQENQSQGFFENHDRDAMMAKFAYTLDSLRKENEDLHRQLENNDQAIIELTQEFEPTKRNLILKLAKVCEKLKLKSPDDYECWIHDIEVSRIRARLNEQTIIKLEQTLKEYKVKIVEMEKTLKELRFVIESRKKEIEDTRMVISSYDHIKLNCS